MSVILLRYTCGFLDVIRGDQKVSVVASLISHSCRMGVVLLSHARRLGIDCASSATLRGARCRAAPRWPCCAAPCQAALRVLRPARFALRAASRALWRAARALPRTLCRTRRAARLALDALRRPCHSSARCRVRCPIRSVCPSCSLFPTLYAWVFVLNRKQRSRPLLSSLLLLSAFCFVPNPPALGFRSE